MRRRMDEGGGARFGVGDKFVCAVAEDAVADVADRATSIGSQQMGLEGTVCHWRGNPMIFSWFNFCKINGGGLEAGLR